MRVVNDKNESAETSEVGFSALLTHILLTGLGVATVLLGPLPMILSHLKLNEPWPKVAAVGGALIALLVLEVPMPAVLVAFVFGLFIADNIVKEIPFWKLLSQAVLISALLGAGALFFSASIERSEVLVYWGTFVDGIITQVKESVQSEQSVEWSVIRGLLFYEGPFLYLSFAVISFWLSVGLAAHLGWFKEKHAFSAGSLRNLKLPVWVSFIFVGLFISTFLETRGAHFLLGGSFRLVGSLMFIQGCICLSRFLELRGIRSGLVRTLTYLFAILFGFYAVIGMGVVSPWFFKRGSGKLANLQLRDTTS